MNLNFMPGDSHVQQRGRILKIRINPYLQFCAIVAAPLEDNGKYTIRHQRKNNPERLD